MSDQGGAREAGIETGSTHSFKNVIGEGTHRGFGVAGRSILEWPGFKIEGAGAGHPGDGQDSAGDRRSDRLDLVGVAAPAMEKDNVVPGIRVGQRNRWNFGHPGSIRAYPLDRSAKKGTSDVLIVDMGPLQRRQEMPHQERNGDQEIPKVQPPVRGPARRVRALLIPPIRGASPVCEVFDYRSEESGGVGQADRRP